MWSFRKTASLQETLGDEVRIEYHWKASAGGVYPVASGGVRAGVKIRLGALPRCLELDLLIEKKPSPRWEQAWLRRFEHDEIGSSHPSQNIITTSPIHRSGS
jgi:hypothetical protein